MSAPRTVALRMTCLVMVKWNPTQEPLDGEGEGAAVGATVLGEEEGFAVAVGDYLLRREVWG